MHSFPVPLQSPNASLRHYLGSYEVHAHDHAQILVGRSGRLELEVAGRAAFVDASCGLVIPAGAAHAFMATQQAQVLVVDAPAQSALQRVRRFALAGGDVLRQPSADAQQVLLAALQAPRIHGNRRGLEMQPLDSALDAALHEPWSTARMAALFCMSPQRFHARWLELSGHTPQHHLRQRRMARATVLLRQGLGLEAVALQVGYRSASALAFALQRDLGQGARGLRQRRLH